MSPTTPVLDAEWFSRFSELEYLSDTEWMQQFTRLAAQERVRFFNDEIENPRFRCDYKDQTQHLLEALMRLRDDVASREENPFVKQCYLEKIDKQLIRTGMYHDASVGDDASFYRKSTRLYGKPKKRYFAYIAQRMKERIAAHRTLPAGVRKRLEQTFSKIDTARAITSADVLPTPVHDVEAIDAPAVANIFSATLARYEIEGWQVVIDETATRRRFSVNGQKRLIYIPTSSVLLERAHPMTRTRAHALAEHEIGVHVRRAHLGYQQPLRLLSIGLSGYLVGEEGLAGYVQQQVEGAEEFYGFDRYLAASLAIGMDGTPRDFRSLFVAMRDYYLLMLPAGDTQNIRANDAAWEVCTRLYRGTTGEGTGCIFTRDISYFEGNVQLWDLVAQKPHAFEEFFIGKYNPCNAAHVEALQALGILSQW
jgi:hypothetical protein